MSYQRKYLRAPYKNQVIIQTGGQVFTINTRNLSEGGLLLAPTRNLKIGEQVKVMMAVPEYPYFKNYKAQQLISFNMDLVLNRVIRFDAKVVRVQQKSFEMGLEIVDIDYPKQQFINQYVERMSANLIYLQIMLDAVNSQPQTIGMIRRLCDFLGYKSDLKLPELTKVVNSDYRGLEW